MKEVNWSVYGFEIEKSFSAYPTFDNSNDMSNFLVNSITSAANKACKVMKPFSSRTRSPPWRDDQCTLSVYARNKALRTYKSNLTFDNFLKYNRKGKSPFFEYQYSICFMNIDVIILPQDQYSSLLGSAQHLLQKYDNPCTIFMDGSKSQHGVSCGIFIQINQESLKYKLDVNSSIFTNELVAIENALDWTIANETPHHRYIMSYSKSSLLALRNSSNV
nr:unnamed protein product [Callosobruchus analis]